MLAAKQGLVVPMLLRLSQFKLNSYVVLVVSKQKGITLVFKTDPLQNVDIHSTFDSIAVIQKFIQREIEGQLRQMFREDLPGIIHRLSQQWVKTKVEAPYMSRTFDPSAPPPTPISVPSSSASRDVPPRRPIWRPSSSTLQSSSASSSSGSVLGEDIDDDVPLLNHDSPDHLNFPDLEVFDPTYGLRSGGRSHKGSFGGLGKLYARSRGLADLTEELDDVDEHTEFDASSWDDDASSVGMSHRSSAAGLLRQEYEVTPAVGGGTISRPRIVHSQSSSSRHSPPSYGAMASPLSPSISGLSSATPAMIRPSLGLRMSSVASNPYFPRVPSDLSVKANSTLSSHPSNHLPAHSSPLSGPHTFHSRPSTTAASHRQGAIPTPPSSDAASANDDTIRRKVIRRPSLSSLVTDDLGFPTFQHAHEPAPSRVVLRPGLSNTVSKFSTLSHSNHTLSPFTRSMEHFAVRSGPPRATPSSRSSAPPERMPQKAKRKRIYHLGGKKIAEGRPSPPAVSEVGSDDMDRYFRVCSETRS
jgi:distribution and morphology protein 34